MKRTGPIIIILSVVITVSLFLLSKPDISAGLDRPLLFVSQLTALVGTVLLSGAYILSSRLRILETLFGGLDVVYKTHHVTAGIAVVLLIQHPLLLIINSLPSISAALKYILPGNNLAYTLGIAGLMTMIVLVFVTLYVDLPYHIWKKTHDLMGMVILLGGAHAYLIPSDISRFLLLRMWMLSIIAVGIGSFIYKRFLYQYVGPVFRYVISSLQREGDVIRLTLTPVARGMSFIPGQFVFLTPDIPGAKTEEHPFSIASSPEDPALTLCIKISGDYTLQIPTWREGDVVKISGPYGSFGERFVASGKTAICIAGGIGITPIRSMALYAAGNRTASKQTHIIYVTRTADDAIFDRELSFLCQATGMFCYHHHQSQTQGRLSAGRVRDLIGDLRNAIIYLCGPPPMMKSLTEQFVTMGIPRRHIVFEDFSFR